MFLVTRALVMEQEGVPRYFVNPWDLEALAGKAELRDRFLTALGVDSVILSTTIATVDKVLVLEEYLSSGSGILTKL